jgi:VWFA-related protein
MTSVKQLAVLLLLSIPLSAQTLSEAYEVHVLEVEAVVLDRAGKPVRGLTRDDFEVRIDGEPAKITNFYAVDRGNIVDDRVDSSAADSETHRMPTRLVVVFDDLHLRQAARKRALNSLKSYVETSMDPKTTAMILRWNGTMRTRVESSGNPAVVMRAIGEMEREASLLLHADSERRRIMRQIDDVILHPVPGYQDTQATIALRAAVRYVEERTRDAQNTTKALASLITLLSGLDGRKTLLFVSEAMPQQPGVEVLNYARQVFTRNPVLGFDLEREAGGSALNDYRYDQASTYRDLVALAQSAGVVFSALDPGGVRANEGTGSEYTTGLGQLDSSFIRGNDSSGARMIANETGGRYVSNLNDLDQAIAILTDDVTTYYSIGVKPENERRVVDVSVRVRGRDDLRVLTPRRRDVATGREAIASAIRARLYSRETVNPLDVKLAMGTPWPRGNRCVGSVQLTVPTAKLTPMAGNEISVHAMVVDDRGKESKVRSSEHAISTDADTIIPIEFGLGARRYVISFAVIDKASGETTYIQGSIDATICGR